MNSEPTDPTSSAESVSSPLAVADASARRPVWQIPFLALTRPAQAAAAMVAASRPAFVGLLILGLPTIALTVIALMLWSCTVELVWVPAPPATGLYAVLTAMFNPFAAPGGEWRVVETSVSDVWRAWRAESLMGWLGPAEFTLILVFVFGLLLLPLLGWLNLPFVHRTGSVVGSYKRALRAGTTVLWPLALAILVCGAVSVYAEHSESRAWAAGNGNGTQPEAYIIPMIAVALWGLILWLHLALRGAAARGGAIPLPPRCEACGYDLTHRPSEGRCPECGQDVDASLEVECSRPDRTRSRSGVFGWWRTTWAALWHTRRFYRALPLRGPAGPGRAFAIGSYALLLGSGLAWSAAGWLMDSGRYGLASVLHDVQMWSLADGAIVAGLLLIATSFVWFVHRLVGALAVSWWLVRKTLPDYGWSSTVMAYESSFVWAYSVYWGALSISYVFDDSWISHLFGWTFWRSPFLGLPAELAAYPLGAGALGLVWLWRFHVAGRAIRWSNF